MSSLNHSEVKVNIGIVIWWVESFSHTGKPVLNTWVRVKVDSTDKVRQMDKYF